MTPKIRMFFIVLVACAIHMAGAAQPLMAAESPKSPEKAKPGIALHKDMTDSMKRGAAEVTRDLTDQARSLFAHTPLGWDVETLMYLYDQALSLPGKLPDLVVDILLQGRVLGVAGSILVLVFLVAVVYSLIGRRRVLLKAEQTARPLLEKLPEAVYPFIMLGLLSITAALIPLLLYGLFSLIQAFISYKAAWFLLTGRLLGLWSIGALIISLIRGVVEQKILKVRNEQGGTVVRLIRIIVLYILFVIAVFWSAEAFGLRDDFLAFLRFLMALSIVLFLFAVFLRKKAVLSLLPQVPDKAYQTFLNGLDRYYYPLITLTLVTGLLWCAGYQRLCIVLLTKTWAVAGVYIVFSMIYYGIEKKFRKWSKRVGPSDETTQNFIHSLKGFTLYIAVIIAGVIILHLLGILSPLQRVMSFPLFQIGEAPLSSWIMIKAGLIIVVVFYISRLVRAFLNYKTYPSMNMEPGPAYAIDTFLHYVLFFIGGFIALSSVGFDFRAILVFAGAIGVGLGFALQGMAANLISGFDIIFGGAIRKGDWLEVAGKLGMVMDIHLRETKIRTRDNIEYIIPNADLKAGTVVNYSLSSPMIRIEVPFGVSYASDPRAIEALVLGVAEKEPAVAGYKKPEVLLVGYGDNSIDFQLLVWIDIRKNAPKGIRSRLYYAIFEAFTKEGVEIPFPQRDIHVRSGIPWEKMESRQASSTSP